MSETEKEHSSRLFWAVQTVFGVVIGRSFFEYKDIVLNVTDPKNSVAVISLVFVYVTALFSWIDFSYSSIVSPYRLAGSRKKTFPKSIGLEHLRFFIDLIIVACYCYLLVFVSRFAADKSESAFRVLVCTTVVYLLYLFAGLIRRVSYGPHASRVGLLTIMVAIMVAVTCLYSWLFDRCQLAQDPASSRANLNFYLLIFLIVATFAYREIRRWLAERAVYIGVDVDGVLANQIGNLIPVIKTRHGLSFKHQDFTEWDLQITPEVSLKALIEEMQKIRKYVLEMPAISCGPKCVRRLIRKHRIIIVTARSPESDPWTKAWLEAQGIFYDEYSNTKEGEKQNAASKLDVLIDDYLGNVTKYLDQSDGRAILFDQPWNQERTGLEQHFANGRLVVAHNWCEVEAYVNGWFSWGRHQKTAAAAVPVSGST